MKNKIVISIGSLLACIASIAVLIAAVGPPPILRNSMTTNQNVWEKSGSSMTWTGSVSVAGTVTSTNGFQTPGRSVFGAIESPVRNDTPLELHGLSPVMALVDTTPGGVHDYGYTMYTVWSDGTTNQLGSFFGGVIDDDANTGYSFMGIHPNYLGYHTTEQCFTAAGAHGITLFNPVASDPANYPGPHGLLVNGYQKLYWDGINLSGPFYFTLDIRNEAQTKGVVIGYHNSLQYGLINSVGANSGLIFETHNGALQNTLVLDTSGNVNAALISRATNGFASLSTTTSSPTATGWTNPPTGVTMCITLTNAVDLCVYDNAGGIEYTNLTITQPFQFRLQPNGYFTGTSISNAPGGGAHAW